MSNSIVAMGNLVSDPFKNEKVVILTFADNRVGAWAKKNYQTNFFKVFFNIKDGAPDVQAQIAMEKKAGDYVVVQGELCVKTGEYKGKPQTELHINNARLYGPKTNHEEDGIATSPVTAEGTSKEIDDAFGGI